MKGTNGLQLCEAAVMEAVQEYLDKRLNLLLQALNTTIICLLSVWKKTN